VITHKHRWYVSCLLFSTLRILFDLNHVLMHTTLLRTIPVLSLRKGHFLCEKIKTILSREVTLMVLSGTMIVATHHQKQSIRYVRIGYLYGIYIFPSIVLTTSKPVPYPTLFPLSFIIYAFHI